MSEDIFVIIRYALAEPKKETGSFEEQNFTFNFIAENGLDNAIKDINNYILSKYCEKEQKKQIDAEVLDKIRAEIADIYCGEYCEKYSADAVREMALDIIDKYKAESEE